MEFTLDEGNFLIIPSGWNHLVFSEHPNPLTSVNIALSLWRNNPTFNEVHTFEDCCDYSLNIPSSSNVTIEDYYRATNDSTPMHGVYPLPSMSLHDYESISESLEVVTVNETKNVPSTTTSHYFPFRSYKMLLTDFIKRKHPFNAVGKTLYGVCKQDVKNNHYVDKVLPPAFKDIEFENCIFWINYGYLNSYLHYDTNDNILYQLQGRKRVFLFPPSERPNLYMCNPYPLRLIYSLQVNDNSIQLFKNALSSSFCSQIVEKCKHDESSILLSKIEIDSEVRSILLQFFDKYKLKLYNSASCSPALTPEFEARDVTLHKRIAQAIDEFSNAVVDGENTKHSFTFYWFMNSSRTGPGINIHFRMKTQPIPSITEGTLIFFPSSFMYEHSFTTPYEDLYFIKGYFGPKHKS